MKMKPIESSETSAFKTQTPEKYPKENITHIKHGESLKSRICLNCLKCVLGMPVYLPSHYQPILLCISFCSLSVNDAWVLTQSSEK